MIYGWVKLLVLGKVEAKRLRGRSPTRWSDQIRAITAALRRAEYRVGSKQFVNVSVKAFQDVHDLQQ